MLVYGLPAGTHEENTANVQAAHGKIPQHTFGEQIHKFWQRLCGKHARHNPQ